ncbi:MAG: Nre family DNA repair protein [Candidatus Diapherotrites archaeon]
MISPKLCIKCKGRLFCGLSSCVILDRYSTVSNAVKQIDGTSFEGSTPPSLFISWRNYPDVSLAPLSSPLPEGIDSFDSPEQWFGFSQQKILSMREQLIGARKKILVSDAANPSYKVSEMQELAMAERPVEVEVELRSKPTARLSFHESVAPMGPSAEMKSFQLTGNPTIPQKVDYLVSDGEVKAETALSELYSERFNVSYLYKLLSSGLLGVKKQRRFVPTRWSIAATDDIISKKIVNEKVKKFPQLGETLLFNASYLDNNFWVLLFPSSWCFEQLEAWLPGASWAMNAKEPTIAQDHEFFNGRKTYAENISGAYYSARLAVAEYFAKEKRQGGAIVFREVGEGYGVPLGVWVIRETVRKAMQKKPLSFSSLELSLKFLEQKLKIPMQRYKKESKLLDLIKNQRKISEFV